MNLKLAAFRSDRFCHITNSDDVSKGSGKWRFRPSMITANAPTIDL